MANETCCCESSCACESTYESACGCGSCDAPHNHSDAARHPSTEGNWRLRLPWFLFGMAGACLIVMFFLSEDSLPGLILGLAACLLAGWRVFRNALRALLKFNFNEGLMMLVAVAACFALGDVREAVAISLFFALGQRLEGLAGARSRRAIEALSALRPDEAHRSMNGQITETVPAGDIEVGDEFTVLPFERVPLDGVVLAGTSGVDTSSMTGESVARETGPGDALLSGFVNGGGSLTMRATALARDSAASRLLALAERAARQKSGGERFLLRFAKLYTPVVMALGALLAVVPSLITGDWAAWVPRGLLFLVSACPCAVVLSVPLGFFAAIGGAARRGVLVKGGRYMELLARAEIAVFDKTGTLTTSDFKLTEIIPSGSVTQEELLRAAAIAEQHASHPFAKAILNASPKADAGPEYVEELPGGGVIATAGGRTILCGSRRMLESRGIDLAGLPAAQVYVAQDGRALGAIRCESAVHPEAPQAIAMLRESGVKKCAMLTGDAAPAAKHAAEQCNLDEAHAALLPEDKLARLQELKKGGTVFYVGDGVNDAPVLALADAGVAMGYGAQAACEAADAVVMGNSLLPLARARALFKKALRVTRANVIFALSLKALVIAVGLLLPVTPVWLAVFADVGVLVITVANAGRLAR